METKDGNGSSSGQVERSWTRTQNPRRKPEPAPNPISGEDPPSNPTGNARPRKFTAGWGHGYGMRLWVTAGGASGTARFRNDSEVELSRGVPMPLAACRGAPMPPWKPNVVCRAIDASLAACCGFA